VVLGDVSRRADIKAACHMARPHTVYHAAAYEHVPIGETSVIPAARTNVLGTVETVRAAREVGARLLLVSSDKAAYPTSVTGATRRLAELVALYQRSRLFRPVVVRFGNILGGRGSVVEAMADAVRAGRKVPVTDLSATGFFMTAEEAVSLVIKADLIGRGGDVFWLDMGQPLRIGDLAERIIDWATPAGQPRVAVDIIGPRPGEKPGKEPATQGFEMKATSHPRIWQARQHDVARTSILRAVIQLRRACASGDAAAALEALADVVPDYEASDASRKAARLASLRAKGPSSHESVKVPAIRTEVFGR
jgi:FlaA1/EpsC-like NDP-sugar epimerase